MFDRMRWFALPEGLDVSQVPIRPRGRPSGRFFLSSLMPPTGSDQATDLSLGGSPAAGDNHIGGLPVHLAPLAAMPLGHPLGQPTDLSLTTPGGHLLPGVGGSVVSSSNMLGKNLVLEQ